MHGWALDACRTVVGSGVWTCGLVGVVLGVVNGMEFCKCANLKHLF